MHALYINNFCLSFICAYMYKYAPLWIISITLTLFYFQMARLNILLAYPTDVSASILAEKILQEDITNKARIQFTLYKLWNWFRPRNYVLSSRPWAPCNFYICNFSFFLQYFKTLSKHQPQFVVGVCARAVLSNKMLTNWAHSQNIDFFP